jgi:hypothetical protein
MDYAYNENEPELYPFERAGQGTWDLHGSTPRSSGTWSGALGGLLDLGIQVEVLWVDACLP